MFDLFKSMAAKGVEPDEIIYRLIANAYLEENSLIGMLKLLDEILVKDVVFDKNPAFLLLDAVCKREEFSEVPKSLEEMAEQGLKLSRITCHKLVHGFHDKGNPEKAEYILESLVWFGWIPNTTTVNSIIDKENDVANLESPSNSPKQTTCGVACQV